MTAVAACPYCGRGADPQAPRLVELDGEILALGQRIEVARGELDDLTRGWQARDAERRELGRAMVTAVLAERAAPPPVRATPPAETRAMPWPGADQLGTSDASPRTVQNLLFVLGGVLLGIGAIVFTVVAWVRYGALGQILILPVATGIALTVPMFTRRRGLVATAETFTAIGLLLLALDGYEARLLNVGDVADRVSGSTYAAIVLAVIGAAGLGYGLMLRLTGPKIIALAAAQPILLLLTASHRPTLTLVAAVFATMAAANFTIAAGVARGWRTVAVTFGAIALAVASMMSFAALLSQQHPAPTMRAAGVVVAVAAILFTVSTTAEAGHLPTLGIAVAVLEVESAVARTATTSWHGHPLAIITAVTAATTVVALGSRSRVRSSAGLSAAAWISAGVLGIGSTLDVAGRIAFDALLVRPLWHSDLHRLSQPATVSPSVPIAIALAFTTAALLGPGSSRFRTGLLGAVPLVFSIDVLLSDRWWTPPLVDVIGIVALLAVSRALVRRPDRFAVSISGGGALALAVHAAALSLTRPAWTAVVVGGLVVVGFAALSVFSRVPNRDRSATAIAGGALATALIGLPIAIASLVAARIHGSVVPMRVALAAAACDVLILYAIRRRTDLRMYGTTAVTAITGAVSVTPLVFVTTDRLNLYAMVGRLIIALAVLAVGHRGRVARRAAIPGDLLGLLALGRVVPLLVTMVAAPYAWIGEIWAGAPHGVGIAPADLAVRVDTLDVVTAALFTASVTASGAIWRGRRGAISAGVHPALIAALVAVAATGAPWPTLPIVAFGLGVTAIMSSAVMARTTSTAGWTGLVVAGAGLAGLLATAPLTLAGLACSVVVALVIAATGRSLALRVTGWCGTVVLADLLVIAAMRAEGAGPLALGLMGVAALASVTAPGMRWLGRSASEVHALDAVAHGTAFVALVTASGLAPAAIGAAGWGLLVAVRTLWIDIATDRRRLLLSGAMLLELIAWWLIAADKGVHRIDAYTVPAAVVGLLAGWLGARSRPELNSWAAYGTALAIGFLPSLAPVYGHDPQVGRQLVVGSAAVVVALIGARARLQAPLVIGGIVAVLLALPDLARLSQHLPVWMPLSAAGLAVIGVASTYERRRRDWSRIRDALGHLS
jgi:hypothetical protein